MALVDGHNIEQAAFISTGCNMPTVSTVNDSGPFQNWQGVLAFPCLWALIKTQGHVLELPTGRLDGGGSLALRSDAL